MWLKEERKHCGGDTTGDEEDDKSETRLSVSDCDEQYAIMFHSFIFLLFIDCSTMIAGVRVCIATLIICLVCMS